MHNVFRFALSAVLLGLVLTGGCDYVPSRPILKPPKNNESKRAEAKRKAETVEAPAIRFDEDWEAWFAYYLNNQEVGYSHLKAEAALGEGSVVRVSDANVRYVVDDQVRLRVGNGTMVTHLNQVSKETPKGVLLNFESTLHSGSVVTTFSGNVMDNMLSIERLRATDRKTSRIPWQTTYRGLHAVDQSLRRQPLELNETRNIDMLLPIQHKLARIEMFSAGNVAVPLLDQSYQRLTEVVISRREGEKSVPEQVVWVNEKGEIQKRLYQATGLIAYRIDGPGDLKNAVPVEQITDATLINVRGKIERPNESKQVPFIIRPSAAVTRVNGKIAIPPAPSQYVRKMEDGSWQILVAPLKELDLPGFKTMTQPPTEADLKASRYIDSNHGEIRRFTKTITIRSGAETTQTQLAKDILETTKQIIGKTEQSSGFVKASTVAQKLAGDHLEMSIFLVASLRAAKIPARLAAGFVYVPGETPRMVYRVWAVAYVDDRWIALDAAEGKIASPNRLTLVTTPLAGGKEYDLLSPAINALGRLDVEIRQVIY